MRISEHRHYMITTVGWSRVAIFDNFNLNHGEHCMQRLNNFVKHITHKKHTTAK